MKKTKQAIGIDLGGTRVKAVLIDDNGKVLVEKILATDDKNGQWKHSVKNVFNLIANDLDDKDFVVGLSAPGIPNFNNSCIQFMPDRLLGIENFNWSEFLDVPVHVVNDAIAALAAEARFGAAKNSQDAVMITIGTGVGGALLINGKIHQGAFQKAGHIGHMSINENGDPDICGMPGSLEEAIGNYSIEKRSSGLFKSTSQLIAAVEMNDENAKTIWLKSVRSLAIAIASIGNILSPEKIVLGGGITKAGILLTNPLKEFLSSFEWKAGGSAMDVEVAHFGEQAGAIGAAAFALSIIENNLYE
jgi:glucokinase